VLLGDQGEEGVGADGSFWLACRIVVTPITGGFSGSAQTVRCIPEVGEDLGPSVGGVAPLVAERSFDISPRREVSRSPDALHRSKGIRATGGGPEPLTPVLHLVERFSGGSVE
jgi:hypothetical protein